MYIACSRFPNVAQMAGENILQLIQLAMIHRYTLRLFKSNINLTLYLQGIEGKIHLASPPNSVCPIDT